MKLFNEIIIKRSANYKINIVAVIELLNFSAFEIQLAAEFIFEM